MTLTLNPDQTTAKQRLMDFLVSDDKFFCLTGPGGVGKTTVLGDLEGDLAQFNARRKVFNLPQYTELHFCATTNKASTLFGNAQTVHKLFSLRPQTNYRTGETKTITTPKTREIRNAIIVVDEASMLEPELTRLVGELTPESKVIFLLDPYQLAPVGHAEAYVHTKGHPTYNLMQPMRQDPESHLYQVCMSLRQAVENQSYVAPVQGEGVRFVDGPTFKAEIEQAFRDKLDARVVAYTNKQVEALNKFVRRRLHNAEDFRIGDWVVAANSVKDTPMKVEASYQIQALGEDIHDVNGIPCRRVVLGGHSYLYPVDKAKYFSVLKQFHREAKAEGNWLAYYDLKESVLDMRDAFACTAHKSQGSTYDKVFIDFADICSCRDLNTFLRMLYVAVSRARFEVVIYGL